jgi:hypothetical protein
VKDLLAAMVGPVPGALLLLVPLLLGGCLTSSLEDVRGLDPLYGGV